MRGWNTKGSLDDEKRVRGLDQRAASHQLMWPALPACLLRPETRDQTRTSPAGSGSRPEPTCGTELGVASPDQSDAVLMRNAWCSEAARSREPPAPQHHALTQVWPIKKIKNVSSKQTFINLNVLLENMLAHGCKFWSVCLCKWVQLNSWRWVMDHCWYSIVTANPWYVSDLRDGCLFFILSFHKKHASIWSAPAARCAVLRPTGAWRLSRDAAGNRV